MGNLPRNTEEQQYYQQNAEDEDHPYLHSTRYVLLED